MSVTFRGDEFLSMSALPYSVEQLDEGEWRHQRHPDELKDENHITLCIDKVQAGVGGMNSWGALPLDEHRVHYANRNFSFAICPSLDE